MLIITIGIITSLRGAIVVWTGFPSLREELRSNSTKQSSKKIMKQPAVYIIANKRNGTIYVGVTSNLVKRIYEHKNNKTAGFSKKYDCKMLVFYEIHETMDSAITREKQIKSGSRAKKLNLIEQMNVNWKDLYDEII